MLDRFGRMPQITVKWYLSPIGLVYLALLVVALVVGFASDQWVVAAALLFVAVGVVVPYKLARERSETQSKFGETADAVAKVQQDAADDAAGMRTSVDGLRRDLTGERAARTEAGDRDTQRHAALEAVLAEDAKRLEMLGSGLEAAEESLARKLDEDAVARVARTVVNDHRPDLLAETHRIVDQERSDWSLALAKEAAHHISAENVVLLVTPQRTGSTWVMDMLRCAPSVVLLPTADLYRALGVSGNRYPGDLSRSPRPFPIELRPNVGGTIPALEPPTGMRRPEARLDRYAIEKVHPTAVDFDAPGFVRRVERLADDLDGNITLLYLIRRPADSIRSFISYQRRGGWHQDVPRDGVVELYRRSYEVMAFVRKEFPGSVLSYDALREDPTRMSQLFERLAPHTAMPEDIARISSHAIEATRRGKVESRQTGPFVAPIEGDLPSDFELSLGFGSEPAGDSSTRAYAECLRMYNGLLDEVATRAAPGGLGS